jgi:hypothetical protein
MLLSSFQENSSFTSRRAGQRYFLKLACFFCPSHARNLCRCLLIAVVCAACSYVCLDLHCCCPPFVGFGRGSGEYGARPQSSSPPPLPSASVCSLTCHGCWRNRRPSLFRAWLECSSDEKLSSSSPINESEAAESCFHIGLHFHDVALLSLEWRLFFLPFLNATVAGKGAHGSRKKLERTYMSRSAAGFRV